MPSSCQMAIRSRLRPVAPAAVLLSAAIPSFHNSLSQIDCDERKVEFETSSDSLVGHHVIHRKNTTFRNYDAYMSWINENKCDGVWETVKGGFTKAFPDSLLDFILFEQARVKELHHLMEHGTTAELHEFCKKHRALIDGPLLWRETTPWQDIVERAPACFIERLGSEIHPSFTSRTSQGMAPIHLFLRRWERVFDPNFLSQFKTTTKIEPASVPIEVLLLFELGLSLNEINMADPLCQYQDIVKGILPFLIGPGVEANIQDNEGNNTLGYCFKFNQCNVPLYNLLMLSYGANSDIRNKHGVNANDLVETETSISVSTTPQSIIRLYRWFGPHLSKNLSMDGLHQCIALVNKNQPLKINSIGAIVPLKDLNKKKKAESTKTIMPMHDYQQHKGQPLKVNSIGAIVPLKDLNKKKKTESAKHDAHHITIPTPALNTISYAKTFSNLPAGARALIKHFSFHTGSITDLGTRVEVDKTTGLQRIIPPKVQAIVNAANPPLQGGGGVDGAIHASAGAQQLQEACQQFVPDKYGTRCPFGEVRVTPGFKLGVPIFHTVGPKATMGNAEQLLQNCYVNCLNEAERLGLSSIAFPCISTGVYGYKADSAAKLAVITCLDWLLKHPNCHIKTIWFATMGKDHHYYMQVFDQIII